MNISQVIPTKIELTPEQQASLVPIFDALAAHNASAKVTDKCAVFAQVSREAMFVVLVPAAPTRRIEKAMRDYRSSIALVQPGNPDPVAARAEYEFHMGRPTLPVIEGEDVQHG